MAQQEPVRDSGRLHDEFYGNDAHIHPANPNYTEIIHRVSFFKDCCYFCHQGTAPRKYFHILENSYEINDPMSCFCLPPNVCCPGSDFVRKHYFDRGMYDKQSICWCIGCLGGEPRPALGTVAWVCCCNDCPQCFNNCMDCYCPAMCGYKVAFSPFDTFCFCIPNETCWLHNCFGLFGPKSGQPCFKVPFIPCCLAEGEDNKVITALELTREKWLARHGDTGK